LGERVNRGNGADLRELERKLDQAFHADRGQGLDRRLLRTLNVAGQLALPASMCVGGLSAFIAVFGAGLAIGSLAWA
jgi:hypothetical protein